MRGAHSQCCGLLGHVQLTDGESIWNDKKCHFSKKASVRLPEGFHCSSRQNVPWPTAAVRTFSWALPVVKTAPARAALWGRCCDYPLTAGSPEVHRALGGLALGHRTNKREGQGFHSFPQILPPACFRFCSLQGELDLLRIWKLLIGEFICIGKESPPAPSSKHVSTLPGDEKHLLQGLLSNDLSYSVQFSEH